MRDWPFAPFAPLGYDLIMADPPWDFRLRSALGQTSKSAAGQYRVMSIDEIAAMPVAGLGRGDAVLWCWATHAMIDQQIDVVRRWGFRFATTGVWIKRTARGNLAFGTGYRLRCASEMFIIATLGRPETARNVRTVIEGPIREHSRKPDSGYAAAARLHPAALRRADLFARERRDGWDAWGDEADKFGAAA